MPFAIASISRTEIFFMYDFGLIYHKGFDATVIVNTLLCRPSVDSLRSPSVQGRLPLAGDRSPYIDESLATHGRTIRSKAGGPFELVKRDIPKPVSRQVRVKVQAWGVCHSDMLVKLSAFPGITYPRVPGHEVVGIIDAVGADVHEWKRGQRVGVGC
ncbi:alcohol dehydrogenase catalytic domain-containing protein [Nordella sp. HKS 07]|uniref:alcohol dehydrogenase catalytic domain-containing protein n=1 Tax=Nordella sp. HKS 07 TaxID=2712222 RepID=UPI00352BE742